MQVLSHVTASARAVLALRAGYEPSDRGFCCLLAELGSAPLATPPPELLEPSIADRVRVAVEKYLPVGIHTIQDPNRPLEQQGIDSIGLVEVVMEIEDEFQLTIADDDYAQLTTLNNLIKYVESHVLQPDSPEKRATESPTEKRADLLLALSQTTEQP